MPTRFHFRTSLRFELFYALTTLLDAEPRVHGAWQSAARARLPASAKAAMRRLGEAPAYFAAWPDALRDLSPSTGPELFAAVESIDLRLMQERLLKGLVHEAPLITQLLDERDVSVATVLGNAPAAKREWFAFIGLFPFDAATPMGRATTLLRDDPAAFKTETLALARGFWASSFAATWQELAPALETTRAEKERLFASLGFAAFARAAMLKIEVDEEAGVLRAARGGYELPLAQLAEATFYPSLFNDRRYWSAYDRAGGCKEAHFPCFEPALSPEIAARLATAPLDLDPALVCRALGDPTRWAIATLLAQATRTGTELAKALGLTKATVSHHLAILRSACLLEERAERGAIKINLRRDALASWSSLALRRLFPRNEP